MAGQPGCRDGNPVIFLSTMQRSALHLLTWILTVSSLQAEGAAAGALLDQRVAAVGQLLRTMADDLTDPSDRAALEQFIAAVTEHATLTDGHTTAWMLLTFDRDGALIAVRVNAEVFFTAPPLLQRAAVLHELEHLKSAKATRQRLNSPSERAFDSPHDLSPVLVQRGIRQEPDGEPLLASGQAPVDSGDRAKSASALQSIVRVLVDDEFRAYSRDLLYVYGVIRAQGGLDAYLATLPPAPRLSLQEYYQRHVQPFVTPDGRIDDQRLRRDFIFLTTFPRHFPRYYEAALAWEALQGHVELRLGPDGHWRPTRLIAPAAFLAWLVP